MDELWGVVLDNRLKAARPRSTHKFIPLKKITHLRPSGHHILCNLKSCRIKNRKCNRRLAVEFECVDLPVRDGVENRNSTFLYLNDSIATFKVSGWIGRTRVGSRKKFRMTAFVHLHRGRTRGLWLVQCLCLGRGALLWTVRDCELIYNPFAVPLAIARRKQVHYDAQYSLRIF